MFGPHRADTFGGVDGAVGGGETDFAVGDGMEVARGSVRRVGGSRRAFVAAVAGVIALATIATAAAAIDRTPPAISAVRVSSVKATTVVVTWHTNELSSTHVDFGLTTHYGTRTRWNHVYTTTHAVTLHGLSPQTKYHFRVFTIDRSGNRAYGKDGTFVTASAPANSTSTTTTTSTSTSTTSTSTSTTTASTTTTTTTLPPPPPPPAAGVGYHARPCGFDLNHNGIVGEATDCHVGDGSTTNPFGDGTAVNMLYVDCQNGSDTTGDGTAAKPFHSIQHALDVAPAPSSGKPDDRRVHGHLPRTQRHAEAVGARRRVHAGPERQ